MKREDRAAQPALDVERPGDPLRVLVVDDDRDTAHSTCSLLRLWGHEARAAYDGPAALNAATRGRPNVVLLDIGLPGIDGYEVARRLRQGPGGRPGLLVAVTGYGKPEDQDRARRAGFDVHLLKPVDPEHLQALLTRHANLLSAERGPGNTAPPADPRAELTDRLASTVHGRLGNRVRGLRIVVRDDAVVLQGRAYSYYEKQLVQHTVMESSSLPIAANEIVVEQGYRGR